MLNSGTKLGPYEINGALGAGGMGEVYKARDTRLDRIVAIKILPAHLAINSELKERFDREARAISSLNHPGICHLYDVGSQDGTDFLVMEYLEGETLAARLRRGVLPVEQVLKIGMEIAEALTTAHRAGIVHRDLKPGNIMLTKSGAKLMDFGLAKPAWVAMSASSSATAAASASVFSAATMSSPASPLTSAGTVVGTVQYMSPEQVQGQEVDARSDIFSFGLVLYEMTAGRHAFLGKNQASVAAAILAVEEPPVTSLRTGAPPALDRAIQSCLAKEPDERIQSAHDLKLQLRVVSDNLLVTGTGTAERKTSRLPWAAAALAILAAVILAGLWWTGRRAPLPVLQAAIAPGNLLFDIVGDNSGPPALSPDGSLLVFRAHTENGPPALWLRHMDSGAVQRLEGTEGAQFPFWSPDGRNLAFFSEGKLMRISVSGGTAMEIASAPQGRGGNWGPNDTIVFTPDFQSHISAVSAQGGEPRAVTTLDPSRHSTHRWPQLLPDGKHFLYFATRHSGGDPQQDGVYWASLDGKQNHLVVNSEAGGIFSGGYLLFVSQGTLRAQPFDASAGRLTGTAVTLSDDIAVDSGTWHAAFTVSDTGLLVFGRAGAAIGATPTWYDAGGKASSAGVASGRYDSTRLSPDGRRLAVGISEPYSDIWIIDLQRGTPTRLTFDAANHFFPVWSPDGKRLAYTLVRGQGVGLFDTPIVARNADGSGSEEPLLAGDPQASYELQDWSSDGRYLVFVRNTGPTGHSVWALPLSGDRKPFQVLAPPSPQSTILEAHLSPDGRWLAYESKDESARTEIYVTTFPAAGGKWQISNGGGTHPVWSHDGHKLYFGGPYDSTLRSVEIRAAGTEIQAGTPQPLFSLSRVSLGLNWDVAPDGRFLVSVTPEQSSQPLVLITNWTALLRKK
ncbi:MAG TPA: protein kinase [Terriglobales bacterium]|nr:protein kinase [Terriglobales bacterium]